MGGRLRRAVGGGVRALPDPRISAQSGGGGGRGRSPPRSRPRPGRRRRSTLSSSGIQRPGSATPGKLFWSPVSQERRTVRGPEGRAGTRRAQRRKGAAPEEQRGRKLEEEGKTASTSLALSLSQKDLYSLVLSPIFRKGKLRHRAVKGFALKRS